MQKTQKQKKRLAMRHFKKSGKFSSMFKNAFWNNRSKFIRVKNN